MQAARSVRERANRSEVPYSLAQLQVMSDEGQLPGEDLAPERRGGFLGLIQDLFDGNEHDPIGALGSNYRVTEHCLDAGEPLYVLGHAAMRDDTVALEFTQEHGPLLVSIRGERMVALGGLGQAVGGGCCWAQRPSDPWATWRQRSPARWRRRRCTAPSSWGCTASGCTTGSSP